MRQKINSSREKYRKYFCGKGKSSRSDDYFYNASLRGWEFALKGKPIDIHLEGTPTGILLHMEMKPYEPYKHIEKNYGDEFYKKYNVKRDQLRDKLRFKDNNLWKTEKIHGNAKLTIAKFSIEATTYKAYFEALDNLIAEVNSVLEASESVEG